MRRFDRPSPVWSVGARRLSPVFLALWTGACAGPEAIEGEVGAELAVEPGADPAVEPSEAATALGGADWWAEVSARIDAGSRAFLPDAEGRFRSSRPGATATLDAEGLHAATGAGGGLRLALSGLGRGATTGAALSAASPGEGPALGACAEAVDPSGACVRRVEVARKPGGVGLTEWWLATREGFEQGFVVDASPSGSGPLRLAVGVEGATAELDGEAVALVEAGGPTWRYEGLRAWDADGRALPASFELAEGQIHIVVDDRGARWPVEIDPVLSSGTTLSGATVSGLGASVAGAGDVNNDGYDDVIVGAPEDNSGIGRAYIYLGGATGPARVASSTLSGSSAGMAFGTAVDGAGDVNADGYDDVVVGAPLASTSKGQVFTFHGGSSGLSTTAARTLTGSAATEKCGSAVSSAGDYNNDGYGDIVYGCPGYSTGAGRAYMFKGSASGIGASSDFSVTGSTSYSTGRTVSGGGDLTGDAYDDVLVGAYGYATSKGRVYLYPGSAAGLAGATRLTLSGTVNNEKFGYSLAHLGDTNGDTYGDFAVGSPGGGSGAGKVYIFHGAVGGTTATAPSGANVTVTGSSATDAIGDSVVGVGDVNGDTYSDLVYTSITAASGAGFGKLHLGSSTGISSTAALSVAGAAASDQEGFAAAGLGDTNNDGYADLAISRYLSSAPGSARVQVFLGAATGPSSTPSLSWSGAADSTGTSVALIGDADNDGFDEVAVGAPAYGDSTGRVFIFEGSGAGLSTTASVTLAGLTVGESFGAAVCRAGDMNKDGYDDISVGSPTASSSAGKAYVFTGASTGLSASRYQTLSGDTGSTFGAALSGGGDVNGDGFDDLVVGGPTYNSSAGRAWVYHGVSTGVSATAARTLDGATAGDLYGTAVATGGDPNKDGYDDVLVGAYRYGATTRGRVYAYQGSGSGIGASASQTLDGSTFSQGFGKSLALVGDVNGDTYDDVLIGSPTLSTRTGRVTLYLGGLISLSASTSLNGTAINTSFGSAVSGAGDLNQDGYADVIVGAPGVSASAGEVTVYHGTASGLDSTAATTLSGSAASDALGTSVGGGGDLNGDTYDDVILGAPGVSSSSGAAYVHLGYAEDSDSDGYRVDVDCDDHDAAIHPGATEVCDALDTDEDCSGAADDLDSGTSVATKTVWYFDGDGDTYGGTVSLTLCNQPPSYLTTTGDCDDTVAAVNPAAAEVCDSANTDEDCDGLADNADSSADSAGMTAYYTDADGDGYGSATASLYCDLPAGHAAVGTDCDDTTAARSPGNIEVCDAMNLDEDCDLVADDADSSVSAATRSTWYQDSDGDSYGTSVTTSTCDLPSGYAAATGDCDDGAPAVHPGATEVCDAADTDEDCDGSADNSDSSALSSTKTTWYRDVDADGYGDSASTTTTCDRPTGYAAVGADCDDTTSARSPGNPEVCDAGNVDEDCDALADDADSSASTATKSTYHLDSDGDGYGGTTSGLYCDLPIGYSVVATDCDDSTAVRSPGNAEVCDAGNVDEDCDLAADDADASASVATMTTFYVDGDGDSYGTSVTGVYCDRPSGYAALSGDCADTVAAINPAATEVCDAADTDEDCDGTADNADSSASLGTRTTYTVDSDGDGYGGSTTAAWCDLPSGYSVTGGDCDDGAVAVNPGATEVCDAADTDEDCDGAADNADSSASGATKSSFYLDGDGDGYGAGAAVAWCDLPAGYASLSGDCADSAAAVHPGAQEVCDATDTDEDCDGTADNADSSASAATKTTYYADADGDGYGSTSALAFCDLPSGYAAVSGDCADSAAAINPAATEVCDAGETDEDCDGVADNADSSASEATKTTYYVDSDGDTYGTAVTGRACDLPSGYAAVSGDCDDTTSTVSPGVVEQCDVANVDEDCDGLADNADTSASLASKSSYYRDGDGDSFGGSALALFCDLPVGYAATSTDCEDADAAVFPGAVEAAGDSVDQDCDGLELCYVDADEDGYRVEDTELSVALDCAVAGLALEALPGGDCDDTDTAYNPGAVEADCADPSDYNCDGSVGYADVDGDGWAACSECDDTDAAVNPDATERCDEAGVDEDCDTLIDDADPSVDTTTFGTFYADGDGDGFSGPTAALSCDAPAGYAAEVTDCDDADPAVNPGMVEVCDGAELDEDCSGLADDADPAVDIATYSTFYADADADGYGGLTSVYACDALTGYVTGSTDCDDLRADVNLGALERCDADDTDEDCDGLADDLDGSVSAATFGTFYADGDADGYGDPSVPLLACDPSEAAVDDDTDCDDLDPDVNPGAEDLVGDGLDTDCDGVESCYADVDGDGWRTDEAVDSLDLDCGDVGEALEVAPGGDCQDDDADFHPGALEEDCLDPADYNCDGSVGYADLDGDGFAACEECDDGLFDVNPDAAEVCDGLDNNCDLSTDGADAAGAVDWYADLDEDGFSSELDVVTACEAPEGYGPSSDLDDCDDEDALVNPDATEGVDDELDQDCDGEELCYLDQDGDGYRPDAVSTVTSVDLLCDEPGEAQAEEPTGDCDDEDASAYPGAPEVAGDAVDQDCDGEDLPADSGQNGEDSGGSDGSDGLSDGDGGGDGGDNGEEPGKGCGCASAPAGRSAGMLLSLALGVALLLRRRPARGVKAA